MTDFSNRNSDNAIAVSPALAETQDMSPKGGNNAYFSAARVFTAASLLVTNFIDGSNPPAIESRKPSTQPGQKAAGDSALLARADTGGLSAPSSFARAVERDLIEAEHMPSGATNNAASVHTASDVRIPVQPSPEKQQAAPSPKPQESQSNAPQLTYTRAVDFKPNTAIEQSIKENKSSSEQEKRELAIDRQNKLPETLKVHTVAGMEKAMEEAARLGVSVIVDFEASWCGPCKGMKKDVFSKLEGSGAGSKKAVYVHVDVDQTGDGGNGIGSFLGVNRGSTVPQIVVSAIDQNTGKFKTVLNHSGTMPYADVKDKHGKVTKAGLSNNIPASLPPDYVIQHRQQIIAGLQEKLAQGQQNVNRRRRR